MKPAHFHDVDGEELTVGVDRDDYLVWLSVPGREPLAFSAHDARAIGYALLNAADAARFPHRLPPEQPQE